MTPPPDVAGTAASPAPRFHVQIGSFPVRQDAEALQVRVQSLGYAARVSEGPPFRVWVGGYVDRSTADRLAANLHHAGFDATVAP